VERISKMPNFASNFSSQRITSIMEVDACSQVSTMAGKLQLVVHDGTGWHGLHIGGADGSWWGNLFARNGGTSLYVFDADVRKR
jgi:hypothetical protein